MPSISINDVHVLTRQVSTNSKTRSMPAEAHNPLEPPAKARYAAKQACDSGGGAAPTIAIEQKKVSRSDQITNPTISRHAA